MRKYLGFFAATLALFVAGENSWGLGLGEIRVKSRSEKEFVAFIPLYVTETDRDISARVGAASDYDMLQVARPPFADSFKFETGNDPDRPGAKAVKVTSTSAGGAAFNLVVRVLAGSDSLLENYSLPAYANSAAPVAPPPSQPQEVTNPPEHGLSAETLKAEKMADVEKPAAPVDIAPPKAAPKPKAARKKAEPKPAVVETVVTEKAGIEPAHEVPKAEETSPKPKAVKKKAEPKPAVAETGKAEQAPGETVLVKTSPDKEKNKVVIRSGDTIFSIARSLDPSQKHVSKIVAALYLENRDKFESGKIGVFTVGTVLSYDRVNEIAATLSAHDVSDIIASKGRAEKITEETAPSKQAATVEPTPVAASGEIADAEATEFIEKWRKEWEADGSGLADFYWDDYRSNDGGGKSTWVDFKRQLVESNSNVKITVENLKLARSGSLVGAHFDQSFKSDRYSSAGRKKILMRRFPNGLKITGEFYGATKETDTRHIWAVSVGYVADKESAVKRIDELEKEKSYEAGSFLGEPPYKIFVGRPDSKKGALDLEQKLIKTGEKETKVVKFPFSIRLGVFKDKKTTDGFMEQLKKDGYSPYRMGRISGGKVEYAVYLGAFETRALADTAKSALAKSGLSPVIVVP